jgi:2Fe-2S ferredoxin
MPKVVFINPDQTRVELDVPVGTSLMRAALANHVAGIVGDCGGGLTCATCHVLVDEEFLPKTPPMTANEDQMLDFTAMGRQPNSRLSCQLVMQDELDGLTVQIADPQL